MSNFEQATIGSLGLLDLLSTSSSEIEILRSTVSYEWRSSCRGHS